MNTELSILVFQLSILCFRLILFSSIFGYQYWNLYARANRTVGKKYIVLHCMSELVGTYICMYLMFLLGSTMSFDAGILLMVAFTVAFEMFVINTTSNFITVCRQIDRINE